MSEKAPKEDYVDKRWNDGVPTRVARSKMEKTRLKAAKRSEIVRNDPDASKKAYETARGSILAGLSSDPEKPCQECLASAKAASRQERLNLLQLSIAVCPDLASDAAQLRLDMDEVENMRCARHVYLANDPDAPADLRDRPPPGFLPPTEDDLAEMGLTRDMLTPTGTNFRAAVYVKDPAVWAPPDPPEPKALLAFRGSTPAAEDWENNAMQGIDGTPRYVRGETGTTNESYYKRAVEIGNRISRNQASVHFVGHSLGGGLASAAQGGSGDKTASTYNAAGLHEKTVARYAGEGRAADPKKIKAFRVKGEALTKGQEEGLGSGLAPKAVGEKHDLEPAVTKAEYLKDHAGPDRETAKALDQTFDEDEGYAGHLHSMDQVIAAMEARKTACQRRLSGCIDRKLA